MNTPNQPIGIFDSGIGGLTLARAIVDQMPEENIIYFGDTAHLPYGDKSPATIQAYSLRITDMLLARRCKLILIACNSAASAASDVIKEHAKGRALVMDVIDPVIASLADMPQHTKIGLIGTRQTVQSGVYHQKIATRLPHVTLACRATNLLASAIEEFGDHGVTDRLLQEYLADPLLKDIESLILACTHYPVVKDKIAAILGRQITVIDPSAMVAAAAEQLLNTKNLRRLEGQGEKHFYVSDMTESFIAGTRRFFNQPIHLEHYSLENAHELPPHLACRELC